MSPSTLWGLWLTLRPSGLAVNVYKPLSQLNSPIVIWGAISMPSSLVTALVYIPTAVNKDSSSHTPSLILYCLGFLADGHSDRVRWHLKTFVFPSSLKILDTFPNNWWPFVFLFF